MLGYLLLFLGCWVPAFFCLFQQEDVLFPEERGLNIATTIAEQSGEKSNFGVFCLCGHSPVQGEMCSVGDRSCSTPGTPDGEGHAEEHCCASPIRVCWNGC